MNSVSDPECHRQVLGNRQKAKEKGEGRRGEEGGEPVLQGGIGSVGPNLREAALRSKGARTGVPSTSPG